jgi:ribosomal protein S18 acetylase RimI-like enzyme
MPTAPGGTGDIRIRDLAPADAEAVRSLVLSGFGETAYASSAHSALETAIADSDPDARAAIAVARDEVIGLILYGAIAGAIGTGRVQFVITADSHRRRGIATRLLEEAVMHLTTEGARVVFVELPDEPDLAGGRHLLLRNGFRVEASVTDYFRDGVDLAILRRDLASRR